MMRIIRDVIKYLFLSVFAATVKGLLSYMTGSDVNIKSLVLFAVILFLGFCLLALLVPCLRKFFWFKDKEQE